MSDDEDVIYVDIVPRLDEAALRKSTDKVQGEFKRAGKAIDDGLKDAGKGPLDELRKGTKAWSDGVAKDLRSGNMAGAFASIGDVVENTTNAIGNLGDVFGRNLESIRDGGLQTAKTLDGMGEAASRAAGMFSSVMRDFKAGDAGKGFKALSDSLKELESHGVNTHGAADGLQHLGDKADDVKGQFDSMKGTITEVGGGFGFLAATAPKAAAGMTALAGPLAAVAVGSKEIDQYLTNHHWDKFEIPGSAIWSWHQLANNMEGVKNLIHEMANLGGPMPPASSPTGGLPINPDGSPRRTMREARTPQELYMYGPGLSVPDTPQAPAPPPPAGIGSGFGSQAFAPRGPAHTTPKGPWAGTPPRSGGFTNDPADLAPSLPPSIGSPGGYGPTGGSPSGFGGGGGGMSAREFAHNVMMPIWERMGLTVGDHAADQFGEHQNGALDVMVPSIQVGQQVLQQALQDPNVYGAIFNNQTFGYGHGTTPQDYSSGHTGDPSQDHTNHVHIWYKPGNKGNIPVGMGGLGGLPAAPGGSSGAGAKDVTPVHVTSFSQDAKSDLRPSSDLQGGMTGQIGTELAGDMGLSEGLPGVAKFFTGMLANLAFAPAIGALSAVKQGFGGGSGGGGGLLGMLGGGAGGGGGGGLLSGLFGGGASGGGGLGMFGGGGGGGVSPMGFGGLGDIHSAGGGMGGGTLVGPDGTKTAGGSAAVGTGTGAMGPVSGPTGLTTPKAVGRQMGQDAPQGDGVGFGGGLIGLGEQAIPSAIQAAMMAAGGAGDSSGGFGGGGVAASAASGVISAAAQIGMDELNRTAGYAAQVGGIAAQGLLETFMLSDTPLADPTNTLPGRIAMGIAGARVPMPNIAGMIASGQQVAGGTQAGPDGQPPGQPGQPGGPDDPNAKNADGQQRPWVNIENFHNGSGNPSDGKQAGNDIAWRGQQAQAGAGSGR